MLRAHSELSTTMRELDRRVLTTPFKWVSAGELKKIARPERISTGEWIGGHYRVVFIIVPESGGHSGLSISPQIFGEPAPESSTLPPLMGPGVGPMRGVPVGSNGSLERHWLEIVKKNCGG